ncbi:MAG: Flp pilus assembly protein CpaB [Paracoccaceae bacterium]
MLRLIVLALTLMIGGAAAWMLYVSSTAQPAAAVEAAPPPPPPPPPEVLVAGRPIAAGAAVATLDLVWAPHPDGRPSPLDLRRSDHPDARSELAGHIAQRAFAPGEPIEMGQLIESAAGYLATVLQAGQRAVAVPISAENTAGGFILPGDRVDVLYTGEWPGLPNLRTRTILENVEVLAIDQTTSDGTDDADAFVGRTATLRVTRDQAEELTAARARGDLSLALRAQVDADAPPEPRPEPAPVVPPESVVDAPPPLPAPPARPTILVRRAGESETVILP